MGTYRAILAYLVVYSHTIGLYKGINPGVVAVISFFLLSGYVMTALINKYYLSPAKILDFYSDRIMRIGPQFYFYSTAMLVLALAGVRHNWMLEVPSVRSVVLQYLIVPLNFYLSFPHMLIPQAWSLGLEVTFYLMFPFVLIWRARMLVLLLSLPVFLAAFAGILDNDMFGYRLLPGTLFMFIAGSYLNDARTRWERCAVPAIWALSLVLLVLALRVPAYRLPYNTEICLGLVVGIPIVALLRRIPSGSRVDAALGDVSYGVFLSHNAVAGAFMFLSSAPPPHRFDMADFAIVCVLATGMSWLSFTFLEKPLIARRHAMRGKAAALAAGAGPAR